LASFARRSFRRGGGRITLSGETRIGAGCSTSGSAPFGEVVGTGLPADDVLLPADDALLPADDVLLPDNDVLLRTGSEA
jgi:hypothetical protein